LRRRRRRARIVLQNLPNTCDEIANYTDGECVVAEPMH
jgi:hypothetical protein